MTISYHFTPIRMVYINKSDYIKCCRGLKIKESLFTDGGNKNQFNLDGKKYGYLEKIKNRTEV